MNNLTTRKIVLGLLMILVLAFSVQGIAEALTLTKGTGDFQNANVDVSFTITFTPGLESSELKDSRYTNNTVPDANLTTSQTDRPYYFIDTGDAGYTGESRVSNSAANYYNNEAVTISVSGARITAIGGTELSTSTTSHTLKEDPYGAGVNGLGSSEITVGCLATSPGKVTITVRDATPSEDLMRTDSRPANLVFTTYVVKAPLAVGLSDTVRLLGVTNGVGYPFDHLNDVQIYREDGRHNRVTYRTMGTSGTLYVKEGNRAGRFTGAGTVLETSSDAPVYLSLGAKTDLQDRPSSGSTNRVTVSVSDNGTDPTSGVYIYRRPQLSDPTTDVDLRMGQAGKLVGDAIMVTVTDGSSTPAAVSGIPVTFEVADKISKGGLLSYASRVAPDEKIDAANNTLEVPPAAASILHVRTNSSGQAQVDFEFGSLGGEQVITVKAVGMTKTVKALDTSTSTREISIKSEKRSNSSNEYDLFATVTDNGIETPGVQVTFTAISGGELTNTPSTGTATTGDSVTELTNPVGIAQVIYDPLGTSGTLQISVSLKETGVPGDPNAKTLRRTFNVRGGSSGQQQQQQQQQPGTPTNTITISPSSTTGDPGDTETISVTSSPTGVLVTLSSTEFANTLFSPQSGLTPFTSTLTLPSSTRSYSFFAFGSIAGATVSDSATVTVATTAPGSLTIEALGAPANGSQAVRVTVRESDGTLKSDDLSVTLTGPGISRSVETVGGTGAAAVTVPTATTSYTLTASATGYTSGQITLSTTTGQTTTTTTTTTTRTVTGEADSIEISGQRQRSGTVNEELDVSLRVRVVDANGNGVSNVRVTFRVLSPGRGTFPGARGSGRAIQDDTDRNGYASVDFTPTSTGNVIVRATPAGGIAPVTFIIAVGEASDDDDTAPPSPDVTPSRDISPVVHVTKASRPPMLWVDGGAIYALVGDTVEEFAPSVDNAMNIAIGGGKVYWTEKTGESAGTINSANLNGSDVTELTSILAVPMGIAVDTAGSKLYWTNSRGRIQSANLDGSGITNVIPGGLESPMDLALAGGNAYWTQGNGSVRVANLTGRTRIRDISTGTDTPGSLVINGGKVYWTEMTGDSGGTINSANLNRTGATELASILAVPMGIAVDGARSKLYWTNSRGRVQSANLDGSGITNVVSGLGSPSELVLSNSIAAPAAAPAGTASGSKYDVNGDGTVDTKDSDALIIAVAAKITDAKYDVNGDGTVDINDVVAVSANRDAGAAGAPTLVGMKLSAVQIDRLQEQIDLLIATNDRSPAALRTLIYLQQLLVTARPEKTQLLANYPNPFNPETWIPYELATDTNVRLTIYNTQGVVIRTLQLGHQSAGYYTGRDRAAYWDGRNALGEQVASGLYFYQLETDEMSLMRKMVILK